MRVLVALLSLLVATPWARADVPYRVADLRMWGNGVSSNPEYIGTANGVAFFLVPQPAKTHGLWRTDGTAAGTFALIESMPADTKSTCFISGDTLYFTHDESMWKSDGTVAGTMMVLSDVDRLLARRGDQFFFLRTASRDLWVSNGITDQRPLANLRNGHAAWTEAGAWGDAVFIATESGIWRSDGTVAGTTRLTRTGGWNAIVAGNRLFFVAEKDSNGLALWTSDGTEAGTWIVRDTTLGAAGGAIRAITAGATRVYFYARIDTTATSMGLYVSDGTTYGTHLVHGNGDESTPTGTLDFFVDGTHIGTAQISDASTRFPYRLLLPGQRQISVRYSGDANFFDAVGSVGRTVAKAIPSLRALAQDGLLTISVRGVPGYAPTGTVTLDSTVYPLTDSAEAAIGLVPEDARTITFSYSGDAIYEAATVTIPIERTRSYRMRH